MMRSKTVLVLLMSWLWAGAAAPRPADGSAEDLTAVYLKGRISLSPDPRFAAGVDWGAVFYNQNVGIAVGPDGSVFVLSSRMSPSGLTIPDRWLNYSERSLWEFALGGR